MSVEDVQDDPAYQPRDIDLVWRRKLNDREELVMVEVKWDTYTSGNFAFETKSVVEYGTGGCFLTSDADVWYYCFPSLHRIYVLPLGAARAWFLTSGSGYRRAITSTGKGRGGWHTECALVPIKHVLSNVAGVETIEMP